MSSFASKARAFVWTSVLLFLGSGHAVAGKSHKKSLCGACEETVSAAYQGKRIDFYELKKLSRRCLRFARNAIYAKKGYIFQDAELKAYFGGMEGYSPRYEKPPAIRVNENKNDFLNFATIRHREEDLRFMVRSRADRYFDNLPLYLGEGSEPDPFGPMSPDQKAPTTTGVVEHPRLGTLHVLCLKPVLDDYGDRKAIECTLCRSPKCSGMMTRTVTEVNLDASRKVIKVVGVRAETSCCFGPSHSYTLRFEYDYKPTGLLIQGDHGYRAARRPLEYRFLDQLEGFSQVDVLQIQNGFDWGDLEGDGIPEAIIWSYVPGGGTRRLIKFEYSASKKKHVPVETMVSSFPSP